MKYLLSIVLLALIGFTSPERTITVSAHDWGNVPVQPDLSWAEQVGAQRVPKSDCIHATDFGLILPFLVPVLFNRLLTLAMKRGEGRLSFLRAFTV